MDWHKNIRDVDPETGDASVLSKLSIEDKRLLRVRMIFEAQTKRFKCFFTWLVVLTVAALTIVVI